MKALQQIIEDVKQGENLDLYFTIVVALIVAGLNLFSATSSTLLNSIMLALFAIIAISLVGNRHRLDQIKNRLGEVNKEIILKEYPDELLRNDIERANELWIVGVHATSFFRNYLPTLKNKLKKVKKIRVLLVDPDGYATTMVAARYSGKPEVNSEQSKIRATLNRILDLRTVAPSKLQIKVIDDPLMYGGYMINPDSRDGVIYVQRYSYQSGVTPKFIYYSENPWFGFIRGEIQSLWNRGTDWENQKSGML